MGEWESLERFQPEWVPACLAGDEQAWEALVRHFAPLVLSIPRRLGLTYEDCEDVFQTSFAILYRRLGNIEDPQSLPKWLSTTTTRECWRTLRRRDRSVTLDAAPTSQATAGTPDAHLASLDQDRIVAMALEQLDERCRSLLHLLYATTPTPSYAEVAQALGIAVGTIGPRRARCLRALCDILRASPGGAAVVAELE